MSADKPTMVTVPATLSSYIQDMLTQVETMYSHGGQFQKIRDYATIKPHADKLELIMSRVSPGSKRMVQELKTIKTTISQFEEAVLNAPDVIIDQNKKTVINNITDKAEAALDGAIGSAQDPDANDPRGDQITPPENAETNPDANDPRGDQITPPSNPATNPDANGPRGDQINSTGSDNSNNLGSNSGPNNSGGPQGAGGLLDKFKDLLGGDGGQSAEDRAQEEARDAQDAKDAAEREQREAEAERDAAAEEAERLREELEAERAQEESDSQEENNQTSDENTNDESEAPSNTPLISGAMTNALIVKFVQANEPDIYNRIGAEVGGTEATEEFNASFVEKLQAQELDVFNQYQALSESLNDVQAINAYVVLSVLIADESLFFSVRDDALDVLETMEFGSQFEEDLAFDAYFSEILSENNFEMYASLVSKITGEIPSELITEDNDASLSNQNDDVVESVGSDDFDLEAFIALLMQEIDLSASDAAILDAVIELLNDAEDTQGEQNTSDDTVVDADDGDAEPSIPVNDDIDNVSNDIIYEPAPIMGDDGMIIGWSYPEYNDDGGFAGYSDPIYLDDIPSFDSELLADGEQGEDVIIDEPDVVTGERFDDDLPQLPEVFDPDEIPVPNTNDDSGDIGNAHGIFNSYVETQVKMLLPQLYNKIEMSIEEQFGNLSQSEFDDHFASVTQQHYGHVFDQIQSGYDGVMPGDDPMAMMTHDAQDVVDHGGVDSNLDVLLGTTSEAAPVVQEVAQQGVEVTIEMAENFDLETVINHDIM